MNTNPKKRILILAANPQQTSRLCLDEEVREIENALRRARHRDQLELIPRWAVTAREMRRAVLEESPQIVHFSGHGAGEQGLVLDDETGQVKLVKATALAELFKLFADQVECVLLNACYSEVQAEAIRQHINYVIGMNQPIGDRAAIEFAVGFYDALGTGKDYDFAYNYALTGISMVGIDEANVPVLFKKRFFDVNNDTYPSLWVHGWSKPIDNYSPAVELDWTEYFDRDAQPRQIADQATWDNILLPSLKKAREELAQERAGSIIDIRGRHTLTAAVAIGILFPDTRGYTLRVEQQPTAGKPNLWRSDASPSDAKFQVVEESGVIGEHLVIALGITGNPLLDVSQLLQNSSVPFSATVYAEPVSGTGSQAINSDADAVALALDAKDLIRRYRHKYRANCIHLILFAPVGFCLFLGQRLRLIGDVVCYELVAPRNYQPALKVSTG
ncbi:SAVED domain-containing protein [Nostoc sp. TCL26-01]|uniref:SAVED domain-containing protein n=1 Tax=Nostoc sp. TCL26-01 TaxID=2576904 RepID=UPI0015BB09DD|nr:SAVED domain-containing protein [Nostoc sp. TCL26-01]QLE59754.1 SAVED domain-containing protein [Nostoc sp. TCL26-01]